MTTPTPSPHSPGPWKRHGHQILDATGGIVCDLSFHPREDADARLIANAPEAARLLRELVGAVRKAQERARHGNAAQGETLGKLWADAWCLLASESARTLAQIQKLEGGGE